MDTEITEENDEKTRLDDSTGRRHGRVFGRALLVGA
jgi:hypothetical protein